MFSGVPLIAHCIIVAVFRCLMFSSVQLFDVSDVLLIVFV